MSCATKSRSCRNGNERCWCCITTKILRSAILAKCSVFQKVACRRFIRRPCCNFGRACTRPTWRSSQPAAVLSIALTLCVACVDRVNAISCLVQAPISAPIVEVFREPACQWCPGKRGVVYSTSPGAIAHSGAAGVVSFAGQVGGVRYVVIRTQGGVLVTHGYLTSIFVPPNDLVAVGEPVGQVDERLYFGVRVDGRYVDPLRCMASGASNARRAILIPAPIRGPAPRTP